MTDRHVGYIVVLEAPTRSDDAEPTLAAIRQLRGVVDVRPVESTPSGEAVAALRERLAVVEAVRETLARVIGGGVPRG